MSAAPEAGGGPPSRARATYTAQSRGAAAQQPQTGHRNASVQSERRAVAGAPSGLGGVGGTTQAKRRPPKPMYVPVSYRILEQSHATSSRPADEQPQPPVERVNELPEVGTEARPVTGGSPSPQPHHPPTRPESKWHGGQKPPMMPPEKPKKQPIAFCFTACCILFWLLVIAVGVAVLVIYLIYRPQPPRLRVTSATLNAGYIDENGRGGMALNSDLTVLAAISNPNTRIDIVLHYMQLDLYFKGRLIGTQAVWPAPLHQGPGGNVLRSVHLVVSEVPMTQEDVMVWNATANGRPVALKLSGRFYTQLNFGRWLPFRYWVSPRCTLVLDPPPGGALRRARC